MPRSLRLPLPRACAVISLACLALISGCHRSETKPARSGSGPVPVQIATAKRQSLPITLNAIGTVQPLRFVAVKSQVDGLIEKIHFKEGDEVTAGAALVSIDRRPFENAVAAARADLDNARAEADSAAADAERYVRLDQASVVSKEQFQQLTTKAASTRAIAQARQAALSNAMLQLERTEIRAPISGRTGERLLHEGALVKANDSAQSLLVINQLAPISVAFTIPDNTLSSIRAAANSGPVKVTARVRDSSTPPIEGRLEFIDNNVDPATGTILLKGVFENQDHVLWPGQFAEILLTIGADADAIHVPTSAVQTGQSGSQIFVVRADRTVELRQVKTGRSADNMTVILDGISAGETVVTDGQLRLTRTSSVEPKTLDDAARPKTAKSVDNTAAPKPDAQK